MKTYARVEDKIVVELWPHDSNAPMPEPQPSPIDVFGEDIGGRFVACAPEVRQGWAYDGKNFTPAPAVSIVPEVPTRCSRLGLKRALAETGPDAVFAAPEWPAVRDAIAKDPELQEDWDLALSISRTDPIVEGMIAARKYDAETVDKILVRANELDPA